MICQGTQKNCATISKVQRSFIKRINNLFDYMKNFMYLVCLMNNMHIYKKDVDWIPILNRQDHLNKVSIYQGYFRLSKVGKLKYKRTKIKDDLLT